MKKRALIKILASLFIICLSLCVTFACGSDKNDSIQSESASSSDEHVHNYGVQVFDATCTKDGVIIFTCACGHTYTESITAPGHTEDIDEAVAPTCESTGLTQG